MTEPSEARSALNLRGVLAAFGFITCLAGGWFALRSGASAAGLALLALALVAAVDFVVIGRRKRREPGRHETLFE